MARPARPLTPNRSARHFFGAEMRRYRELNDMSLDRLAVIVNYGKSHLHRVENAESMIPRDLPGLLDATWGTDGHFGRLYGLAKNEAHPDKYRRRMELEAQARIIQEFSSCF